MELRAGDILKPLVYAGAQTGAIELTEIIFRLPVAKSVFEAYKDDSCLPEDIAEENGYKEVAQFLRRMTKRWSNSSNQF